MTSKKFIYPVKNKKVAKGALMNAIRIFTRYGEVISGELIGDEDIGFTIVIAMRSVNIDKNFIGGPDDKIPVMNFPLEVDNVPIALKLLGDDRIITTDILDSDRDI